MALNVAAAKAAGYTDADIAAWEQAKAAGYSDEEIQSYIDSNRQPAPASGENRVEEDPVQAFLRQSEEATAGLGAAWEDASLAVRQKMPWMTEEQGNQEAEALAARQAQDPRLQTFMGQFGRASPTIASLAIPGAGTVRGAALIGAGLGALTPETEGEGAMENMAEGAVSLATPLAGLKAAGATWRAIPKSGAAVENLAERLPILGPILRGARGQEKEAAVLAAREARDQIAAAEKARREAQAVALRQQKAAAKAESEATRAYSEAELRGSASELAGGKDTTAVVSDLRKKGIDAMRAAQKKLTERYAQVEAPRKGVPKVKFDKKEWNAGEIRSSIRDLKNEMRRLPSDHPKLVELRDKEAQLNAALEKWAEGSPEAAAQLSEMRAVDRLFRQSVGRARAEFGVKGTGGKLHEADFPRVEALVAQLRSPTRGAALVERTQRLVPGSEQGLRQAVGAMGTEDLKLLTSPAAKRVLTKAEQEQIDALLQALRK